MLNRFRISSTSQIIYPLIDINNLPVIEVKRNSFAGPDTNRIYCFSVYNVTKQEVQIIPDLLLLKCIIGENNEYMKTSQYAFSIQVADGPENPNLIWGGRNRDTYRRLNKVFVITLVERDDSRYTYSIPNEEELRSFAEAYQTEKDKREG